MIIKTRSILTKCAQAISLVFILQIITVANAYTMENHQSLQSRQIIHNNIALPSNIVVKRQRSQQLYKNIFKYDHILGCKDADNILIHYSSLGCIKCFLWYSFYFLEIKKKYIDTCKVQYVLREIPIIYKSTVPSLYLECSSNFFKTFDLLMRSQFEWMNQDNEDSMIQYIVKTNNLLEHNTRHCINTLKTSNSIQKNIRYAIDIMNVNMVPTFFINGHKIEGGITPAQIEKFLVSVQSKR